MVQGSILAWLLWSLDLQTHNWTLMSDDLYFNKVHAILVWCFFFLKIGVIAIVWSSFPCTLLLPSKHFNIDHNFFLFIGLLLSLAQQHLRQDLPEHYIKLDLHSLMTLKFNVKYLLFGLFLPNFAIFLYNFNVLSWYLDIKMLREIPSSWSD